MKLSLLALAFAATLSGFASIADAAVLQSQQTYRCFTDNYEPGMFVQFTWGMSEQKLLVSNLKSYTELSDGTRVNETDYVPNADAVDTFDIGSVRFRGWDRTNEPATELAVEVQDTMSNVPWPMKTGRLRLDFADGSPVWEADITCVYLGVNP